jgi:hypothetical protein
VQVATLSDKVVWKDQGSGGKLDVALYNIEPAEQEKGTCISFPFPFPSFFLFCSSHVAHSRHAL